MATTMSGRDKPGNEDARWRPTRIEIGSTRSLIVSPVQTIPCTSRAALQPES